jgi:light-regulated signal transduction histidine kinase (bacteriophytochrome)
VRVWPGPETLAEARSFLPELALGAGFLMAFLLALTVHLAQTARLRSRELGLSNQGLVKVIAERKRAEETLKKAHAELQSLNAELEAFTYSVSHDLQAPLRHINGFSKMLVEEFGPRLDSAAQYYVQRIQEGSQQMGQLVDDVLNLRRLGYQKLYRQVTGLNSLVEEVLRNLQPEVEGRQIEWQIGRLPLVDCDPALMKQVFANLLSNALKFTRLRERAVIEVSTMKQEGQPVVFVRDNGVGFSMKYADKLFGVFQRLHRQEDFEGTGVGLATVQRILHKHGGRAWAQAELDKGATFYFTLGTAKNSGTEDTSTAIERR